MREVQAIVLVVSAVVWAAPIIAACANSPTKEERARAMRELRRLADAWREQRSQETADS